MATPPFSGQERFPRVEADMADPRWAAKDEAVGQQDPSKSTAARRQNKSGCRGDMNCDILIFNSFHYFFVYTNTIFSFDEKKFFLYK